MGAEPSLHAAALSEPYDGSNIVLFIRRERQLRGAVIAIIALADVNQRVPFLEFLAQSRVIAEADAGKRGQASVVPSSRRAALFLGNYDVLMDPADLVDVIIPRDTQIALASARAGVLATQNGPDAALVRSLLASPRQGATDRYVFSARQDDGFIAIAIQPRGSAGGTLRRNRLLLVPLALLVSVGLIATLIWMIRRRSTPRAQLAAAVRRRALTVHYQPMIHLATGACVGAEALVRWPRHDGSFVSPDAFIPLAEATGLIHQITDQIIDCVIEDMRNALCADRTLHIAINLSAGDIVSGDVPRKLRQKLAGTGIATRQIWLELTERGFVDIERARAMIVEAHDLGHSIAIDDFGTGYSSLQYLQSLPLDTLKIDKSFIDTIGKETATSSVTPHIIDMARTLDLVCVAEGIETQAQCDYLEAQGVAFGQGWYFSRPLPAQDFIAFCHARRTSCGPAAPSIHRDDALPWQPQPETTPARSIEC